MVAESPNVRRYGVGLFGRELRAAHGGHRAAVQLGDGTPSVMVLLSPFQLSSLQSQLFLVRSEPRGVPLPLAPWQAAQGAPPTWP